MALVFPFVLFLHVLFFAAWFGLGLGLTGRARLATAAEPAVGAALAADGSRAVGLMTGFAVAGYVFALLAFFSNPRFLTASMGGYDWPYHTALTLGLVLVLVQVLLIRPAWARLRATVGAPEALAARKRVAMGTGIGHLTWVVLLVLMFWARFAAAL